MDELTGKAAFELRKMESSDIESLTSIEWVIVQSEEERSVKIEAVKELMMAKKIIADSDDDLAALRARCERLEEAIRQLPERPTTFNDTWAKIHAARAVLETK